MDRHTSPLDIFFDALAIVAFALALIAVTSCAAPKMPDLGKVPRGQFSRTVQLEGATCQAWIPLVVRSDFGQVYVGLALSAAQPWANELGLAVAVPALEGERATLSITFAACPAEFLLSDWNCKRWAQTESRCDAGVLVQEVKVFAPASALELVKVLEHELGHALGVDDGADKSGHSADTKSIMFHEIDFKADVQPADGEALRAAWSRPSKAR